MKDIIVRIVVALLAIVVLIKFIQPLLAGFFPPVGTIILILLFIGVFYYLLGK